jgi:hypothetical protein
MFVTYLHFETVQHRRQEHRHKSDRQRVTFENAVNLNNITYDASLKYSGQDRGSFVLPKMCRPGLGPSSFLFNTLKTKRICFIEGLSAYRAVNTLHVGYKNQSLNIL